MKARAPWHRPGDDPVWRLLLAIVNQARKDATYTPKGKSRRVSSVDQEDAQAFLAWLEGEARRRRDPP